MATPKAPPGGFQEGGWYDGKQFIGGSFSQPGQIHPKSQQVGAGQQVSQPVLRQTSTAAGLKPTAHEEFIASQGGKIGSPEELSTSLNNFQQGLLGQGDAPATRTPLPTVDELKGQLAPGARPAVPKLEETFQALRAERGLEGLEGRLTELKAQEDEVFATLRQRISAAEGKPVALGVIAGRIGELEKQERENLEFIQRQKSRIVDELTTANATIAQIMQFKQLDYGNAKEDYDTQFNQNLQVFDLIRGLRRDEIDEEQRQINNARANLTIYANAAMAGNINYNQMSPDQRYTINKLEAQSGLPIGFVGSLGMSITERLISVNEKTGEALIVGESGQLEVISTGFRGEAAGGTATERASSKTQAAVIADVKAGRGAKDIGNKYGGTMEDFELINLYNQNSPHGPMNESPETFSQFTGTRKAEAGLDQAAVDAYVTAINNGEITLANVPKEYKAEVNKKVQAPSETLEEGGAGGLTGVWNRIKEIWGN